MSRLNNIKPINDQTTHENCFMKFDCMDDILNEFIMYAPTFIYSRKNRYDVAFFLKMFI